MIGTDSARQATPCAWRRSVLRAGLSLLLLAVSLALLGVSPVAQERADRAAVVLTVDGVIGPATADYVKRGLDQARSRGASAVLLRIDTPGGLDKSMRDIVRDILASPVPVLGYVSPSGARAASAGTYILYATHVAAMAPGTNLGAATPVSIGGLPTPGRAPDGGRDDRGRDGQGNPGRDGGSGGKPSSDGASDRQDRDGRDDAGSERQERQERREPASAMESKMVNDAVAYIRSLAELRDRNADWAERAVRDGESLSASAALRENVVDIVVGDVAELFSQAHGRMVTVEGREVALDIRDLRQEAYDPDWRTKVLGIITNPNVALILMMIGIYGLLFEFMSPGSLYPGTIGSICLLLGLYALAALPLNYAGVALLLLGMTLLVAEAFMPSFGALGIGGVVAFAIGAAVLIDTEEVPGFVIYWPVIGALAVAGLGFGLLVARMALTSRRHKVTAGREAMIGQRAEVSDWSGHEGHVFLLGERWNAVSSQPLRPGQRVRVTGLDGLTLAVEPDGAAPPDGDPSA